MSPAAPLAALAAHRAQPHPLAAAPGAAPALATTAADPGDLVARALAILEEETAGWQTRQARSPATQVTP